MPVSQLQIIFVAVYVSDARYNTKYQHQVMPVSHLQIIFFAGCVSDVVVKIKLIGPLHGAAF